MSVTNSLQAKQQYSAVMQSPLPGNPINTGPTLPERSQTFGYVRIHCKPTTTCKPEDLVSVYMLSVSPPPLPNDESKSRVCVGHVANDAETIEILSPHNEPEILTCLGMMHSLGRGTPQNFERAHLYYTEAAEKGYAVAQDLLATMYLEGNGVKKDFGIARHWYRMAASQGNEHAIQTLAYPRALEIWR